MPSSPTVALYVGSFDPITRGHLDVIKKALATFDVLYIGVGINHVKKRLFASMDAVNLICQAINEGIGATPFGDLEYIKQPQHHTRYRRSTEDGSLVVASYPNQTMVDYAKEIGATHIVRGLRQASDFNEEFTLTGVAGHLDGDIIFTHFICSEEYLHISSSTARELASYGSDISWLVTPSVARALSQVRK